MFSTYPLKIEMIDKNKKKMCDWNQDKYANFTKMLGTGQDIVSIMTSPLPNYTIDHKMSLQIENFPCRVLPGTVHVNTTRLGLETYQHKYAITARNTFSWISCNAYPLRYEAFIDFEISSDSR